MSDLYLVLRRRLSDVQDWAELGTETLRDARKAKGLSYEAMGRRLHVVAKTWERWEKSGRVPRHRVNEVAGLLSLEVEDPRAPVAGSEEPELRAMVEQVLAAVERIERAVARVSPDGPAPRRAAR